MPATRAAGMLQAGHNAANRLETRGVLGQNLRCAADVRRAAIIAREGTMPESKPKFPLKSSMASLVVPPLLASAVAAIVAAPLDAAAQGVSNVVMQLQGIKGESTRVNYKDGIDLLSYTQSFRNSAAAGKVNCGAITVIKNIDRSSPDLIGKVVSGAVIPTGAIVFLSSSGEQTEYYRVTLTDLLVTAIDQTDQPDASRIVERVTLQPSQFEFEYKAQSETGGIGTSTKFGYNCTTGKKV
jgi:type VI secretion system secreted protein Hcp